ncbi:MAG: hypothetical protein KKC18_08095 [Chloroflexi bacterium]|nr:hypothetical protein [Chloroflexota bacterium]
MAYLKKIPWSTEDELAWLSGLADRMKGSAALWAKGMTVASWMQGYLGGLGKREQWDHIDPVACEMHARMLMDSVSTASEQARAREG